LGIKEETPLDYEQIPLPENKAFEALQLNIPAVPKTLTDLPPLPTNTVSLIPIKKGTEPLPSPADSAISISDSIDPIDHTPIKKDIIVEVDTKLSPPLFVKPHPPVSAVQNPFKLGIYLLNPL
jgi:hypothetical protein